MRGDYFYGVYQRLVLVPEILINPIFEAFRDPGYSEVEEYSKFGERRMKHVLSDILSDPEHSFYVHAKIATPDKKILLATDFDQGFSYLSSSKPLVEHIVQQATLKGFFCNDPTQPDCSYTEQTGSIIDWSSSERRINDTR